jgi:dipeptidyl aminopeptidase/acylaminoacyl peptidase
MKIKYLFSVFVLFVSCISIPNDVNIKISWFDLGSVSYGIDPNQFVEITVPKNTNQNVNVIFYIHGYGNKMVDLTFLENYRDEYIIGKLDYCYLTPKRADLSMDKLLSDVHNGLIALKNTVEMEGIKINKVIIMGNSLGAALTLMYTYTFFDISPIPIAFCVTMSGLTDMTDAMIVKFTERLGKRIIQKYMLSLGSILSKEELSSNDITELGFSDTAIEALKKISPIYYINKNTLPTIIVHNTNDKTIPFSNAMSLNNILNAYNVPHIFIQSVTDYGHELGPNISNRKGLVFAPVDARLPISTPKRYTRKLHPIIEEKLVESINQYIAKYCQ